MDKPRILIADDDRDLLQLLARQLRIAGYDVTCAQDGYQALDRARQIRPDLVLLDVNMPAGDGFSVQERMAKMSDLSNVPTIYLTGEQSHRVTLGAQYYGAVVIQKPFELERLLHAIRSALDPQLEARMHTGEAADRPRR